MKNARSRLKALEDKRFRVVCALEIVTGSYNVVLRANVSKDQSLYKQGFSNRADFPHILFSFSR